MNKISDHAAALRREGAFHVHYGFAGTYPQKKDTAGAGPWPGGEPWGGIVHQCGTGEEVAVTELELSRIDAIHRQLPILSARRTDLYEVR